MSNGYTAAAGQIAEPRIVDWAGYPALFEKTAPGPRREGPTETTAEPQSVSQRLDGVREAFLGYCQAALFAPVPFGGAESAAARRAFAAAEAFGFTREDVRRLGCGLYPGPSAVREHLRGVGFCDAEIDAARLAADETGRARAEFTGCLVVPLTDHTGCLGDFVLATMDERGLQGFWFVDGPGKSSAIAYGLQGAFSQPGWRESLVLVDNVLDALLLQCRGLASVAAVGVGGRDLSPRRWEQLARLGVGSVTLAFRRGDLYAASVRDALANALRARTAPQVFVANPYPGGERSAADVLRRFGRDTCAVALAARSLAFHEKDFGTSHVSRTSATPVPSFEHAVERPVAVRPCVVSRGEPRFRAAYREHLVELVAALPFDERRSAARAVAEIEASFAAGDLPRAEHLVDAAAGGPWERPADAHGCDTTASPPRWFAPVNGVGGEWAPSRPLEHSEAGRAVLLALRDWLCRECEAARTRVA